MDPGIKNSADNAVAPVVSGLAVLMTVAVLFGALTTGGGQEFADFGRAKQILLPVAYVLFAIIFAAQLGRDATPIPKWITLLIGATALSLILNAFRDNLALSPLAQGSALMLGFSLFAVVGLRTPMSERSARLLTFLLLATACFAAASGSLSVTPFMALVIPAGFGSLYYARKSAGAARIAFLAVATLAGSAVYRRYADIAGGGLSSAETAQIGVCIGVVSLLILPRALRSLVAASFAAACIYWAYSAGMFALVTGNLHSEDVTIAQRSYEASRVIASNVSNPIYLIVGAGPGATVDLSQSPDALTLLAAGRDLSAVDDVHLLPAHLFLKLGLAGIAWMAILVSSVASIGKVVLVDDPDPRSVLAFLFVVSGIAMSIPAATHLFANPLVPLLLGALWRQHRSSADQQV